MATPNYSYEKRQRELAKKRKAEEKRQKKQLGKSGDAPADDNADRAPAEGDASNQMSPPANPSE